MTDNRRFSAEIRAAYNEACLILTDIEATIRKSPKFRPPLSWRFRAKTREAIVEKLARKRRDDPDYNLSSIQDLIGGRFVTLYKGDIGQVVSHILSLIKPKPEEDDGAHNQLKGAKILEFAQHIATAGNQSPETPDPDGITDDLVYVLNEHGFDSEILQRRGKSNYSSVHLVLEVNHASAADRTFPVEIQVRTIFEDAWSEVDHQLLYEEVRKQRKEDGDKPDDSRERMSQDLSFLRRMLDLAGEYAETIKIRGRPGTPPHDPRFESLGDPQYVRKVCRKESFPEDLSRRLVELVEKKEELDKVSSASKEYLKLASNVRTLIEEMKREHAGKYPYVFYLARMEEPIARLRTEDDRQIVRAYKLYEGITKAYPKHPTGWFRRGQAAMKYGTFCDHETRIRLATEAAGHYRETEVALDALSALTEDDRFLLISDYQLRKVKQRLPRLHGYALWEASDLRRREFGPPGPEDFDAMMQAFRMARDGLSNADPKGVPGLRQNMLYYAIDASQLAKELDLSADDLPSQHEIGNIAREVEKEERQREKKEPDIAKWRVLHTLLLAYQHVGWKSQAIDQAVVLLRIITNENWAAASKAKSYLMKRAQLDAAEALANQGKSSLNERG